MSIRSNVDAAEFDQRITIQRKIVAQALGKVSVTYATVGTVWARVDAQKVDQSRREPERAGKLVNIADYVVWIRADVHSRLQLRLSDRILWGTKIFDIVDIMDQQLSAQKLAIGVREGASDG